MINLVNSVIIFLSQTTLLRWLTFLLRSDCDSHSPGLLDFFFWRQYLFYNCFPSIGKFWSCLCLSFHWLSVKFTTGCCISSHSWWVFSCWSGQSSWHLKDVRWEDIFKPSASVAASEFCEWVQVGIDLYIPHRKYQVKPHSSPCFSAACAAAIVIQIAFFVCTNRINLSNVKFRQG